MSTMHTSSSHNFSQAAAVEAARVQSMAADPEYSIYLSASAGTGKTKVLVDRVLRLLLAGTPPRHILGLTYTNAAAYEMQERIRQKLRAWMLAEDDALQAEIAQLNGTVTPELMKWVRSLYAQLLDNAHELRIQTIHGFCAQIMRSFYHQDHYLCNFTIIDNLIRDQLVNQTLEQLLQESEALGVLEAIHILTEEHEWQEVANWLDSMLRQGSRLRRYLGCYQNIEELTGNIFNRHGATVNSSVIQIRAKGFAALNTRLKVLQELTEQLNIQKEKLAPKLQAWLTQYALSPPINPLLQQQSWSEYISLWLTQVGTPRQQLVSKRFIEQYPQYAGFLQEEQAWVMDIEEQMKAHNMASVNSALLQLAQAAQVLYEQYKHAERALEYDDLLAKTIELLKNSEQAHWVLYQIDITLDHVLVDEAQDLSGLQWDLIKILTDEFFAGQGAREGVRRTVFIVGDFKQSIYGFQGASPLDFEQARSYFRNKVTAAQLPWMELQMQVSFRTTVPVLQMVDRVFANFSHQDMGLAEAISIQHVPYRDGGGMVERLELIEKLKNSKEPQAAKHEWLIPWWYSENLDIMLAKKMAQRTATMIAQWLQEERFLHGRPKAIAAGDIMILLRRRGEAAGHLLHALRHCGVPVCDLDRYQINTHLIVQDLLALARFFLLPEDELNLAGLLKSPLHEVDETRLYNLAIGRGKQNLWERVQEKEPIIADQLLHWRQRSKSQSILEFYYWLLEEEGMSASFTKRFGANAEQVLRRFLEAVLTFEQPGRIGQWRHFVQWLSNSALEVQGGVSQSSSGVRIMTIHSAKGLQAPVVIMGDAASSEHQPFERILWYKGCEPYLNFASEEVDKATFKVRAWDKQQREAESRRLLYVAMTRAEDELYICGWENSKAERSWYQICATTSEYAI